jgi:glycosidase
MEITKIDPPCWFAGLKSKELRLLMYGDGLKNAGIVTDIPCRIVNCYGTDKYLFVALNLCDSVEERIYDITVIGPNGSAHCRYEFKQHRSWDATEPTISNWDVVYLVMPDRFAKGGRPDAWDVDTRNPNGWHGGNIAGMTDSLDYLEDLGITALWHTPVFKNTAYHGYAIEDFYAIDEHFGTVDEYKTFVDEAHKRGIKVVMDVVFNHCSIKHPWVGNPPLNDWLNGKKEKCLTNYKLTTVFDSHASVIDQEQTVKGWFTKDMPDINLASAEVLCYMTQMTKWWIETAGIDAIRMDTYLYSDLEAMIKWQNELSKEFPNISVLAEAWVPSAAYTSKIQNAVYPKLVKDSSLIVMDFAFQKGMEQYLDRKEVYDKEASVYYHFVYDFLYSEAQNTLAFLDNHDLPRWFDCVKSKAKLKQALGVLLTVPRIPQIYYGTEFMISNDGKGKGDGNYRVDTFEQLRNSCDGGNDEILNFLKRLLHWRKSAKSIACGTMKHFVPQNGVYVYFRSFEDEKIMVISNGLTKSSNLSLEHYCEELDGYLCGIDVVTGRRVDFEGVQELKIKRNEILILSLSRK